MFPNNGVRNEVLHKWRSLAPSLRVPIKLRETCEESQIQKPTPNSPEARSQRFPITL